METVSCSYPEEPPTTAVLLDNCHFSQVVFTSVEKSYAPGTDIICHYTLSQHITPQKKDWVGIFRVGWKTTREYYTFMWAPFPSSSNSSEQQLLFKAYYLPTDDEYYQFCYIDQDGQVRGASVPFQFCTEVEEDMLVVTTQGEVEEIEKHNKTLLQENQKLKEKESSLQKQNEDLQEKIRAVEESKRQIEDKVCLLQAETVELQRVQNLQALERRSAHTKFATVTEENKKLQKEKEDLQRDLDTLRSSYEKLSLEINHFKKQITDLEAQNSSTEKELQQIKEEKRNLLIEQEQLENNLKTTMSQVDQLQSQVQDQQKEVQNLKGADEDKAKHLEQLKEENRMLNAALLRQQNLEEKLEEKTCLLQTLQKELDEKEKGNQRLSRENEELLAYLPEMIGDASASVLTQSPENSGLSYGNPYSATTEIPERSLDSLKRCPVCSEVFSTEIGEQQFADHVSSHILDCPYCNKTFDSSDKQVYDDHVYCHSLEPVSQPPDFGLHFPEA